MRVWHGPEGLETGGTTENACRESPREFRVFASLQAENQQKQAKIGENRRLTHKNLWKTGINP
jgi:hypothetical protein